MATALENLRVNYRKGALDEHDAAADAVEQFGRWFADAQKAELPEPNAMTLATATPDGVPSARVVLLKRFDEGGFMFFTNYESRKGRELKSNPRAALVFFWEPLERQVRIEGTVERVSREESKAYFDSRPAGSRIGAWSSHQSSVIASRKELEIAERELKAKFGDAVPLPDFWGGYRVVPSVIEFWQGRPSRLHDRLRYTRSSAAWRTERLAP